MSSAPSSPAYTVLRIKRKATEAPLSQLVIENAPKKRFRDVSGRPRGIFKLAETVSGNWQGQGAEEEDLKRKITSLITAEKERRASAASSARPAPPTPPRLHERSALDEPVEEGPVAPLRPGQLPKRSSSASQHQLQHQYRVVPRPLAGVTGKQGGKTGGPLPPKVLSLAEAEEDRKQRINFIDARAVTPSPENASIPPKTILSSSPDDEEMARFLPMLKEYLSMERPELESGSYARAPVSTSAAAALPKEADAADEYVYDLYYRDLRPSLSSTPLGLGVGDGITMGALLGYEDISPPSSPDDSEVEDEADEDSNGEDYYRNDYPEDEDADEDMVGYRDPYGGQGSDEDHYGDSENEEQERGAWDYR